MDNFASRHVPELDGLRGIAIISVLIHHQLTPFLLKGGFLGVDLFFVLSGFLITGLLLAEFDTTKSVSLKNFYVRRLLRLAPALTLYLIACLLVNNHTNAVTLGRQLKLIFFAVVYATNWRMALGWDTALDPTAIIWSLSIEEQFYLVWPLVCFGFLFLRLRRRYLAGTLIVTIVAIIIHRHTLLNAGSELTRLYYGTDTRADALLAGCLAALIPVRNIGIKTKRALNIAAIVAAGCLIYAMISLGFTTPLLYQGGFTLVAFLCALLVFVSAYHPPKILAVPFRWLPLRWLGRISYGLYLWHWLIVANTSFHTLGMWEPWARLTLAILGASASFYLVERPFNRLKRHFGTPADNPERSQPVADVEPRIPALAIPVSN